MPDKRVAVIGSNSFSGSDFIDLLLEEGRFEVLGMSRSPEKGALFLPYMRHASSKFSFRQLDLNDDMPELINTLDEFQPDYVVNFAAQSEVGPSWDHPDQWMQTNGVAIAQLGHALSDRPYMKRYVHISSPEVYGTCEGVVLETAPLNPSTPYAASKAAGDLILGTMAEHRGLPLVMIRSTNIYGPHQQLWKIIPRSAIYIKLGKTIELHGGGQSVKSFIHIRDISRGELLAMEQGQNGSLYHLSPDRGHSVREVVETICGLSGTSLSEATVDVEERLGQDAAYIIDSTKARTEFGWEPSISLDQGIAQVMDWVNLYWNEIQEQTLEYVHQP